MDYEYGYTWLYDLACTYDLKGETIPLICHPFSIPKMGYGKVTPLCLTWNISVRWPGGAIPIMNLELSITKVLFSNQEISN